MKQTVIHRHWMFCNRWPNIVAPKKISKEMAMQMAVKEQRNFMQLKKPDLLQAQAFIDGKWVGADSGNTFQVQNPFNQEVIAELPEMGQAETARAIAAAEVAFPAWRDMNANARKEILDRWVALIAEHQSDLEIILTTEQGKPLEEAAGEYQYLLGHLSFYAGETLRIHGQVLHPTDTTKEVLVIREPFGVTAGIAPWNFPAFLLASKIMQAIAAGNTFVGKPPEDTPLSALALVKLAEEAGVPQGVINILTAGKPKAIGDELTTNPVVRRFSFTGSTAVGKLLYSQCASTMKSVALECGGNSPLVIFEDADIEAAIANAIGLKFYNCGQVCININRFLVHENIHDEFVEKFVAAAKTLKLGSGLESGVVLGPLINKKQLERVERLVNDAVAKGAQVKMGGKRSDVGELFFEPTVLTNMDESMDMYHEEIFGPVAPIYTFKTDEEAMRIANDTEYGLAAYFFTRDLSRTFRVSRELQAGCIGVNTTSFDGGPFGGYKQSGVGREQGRVDTLNEWCEVKSISLQHT
jgi:succinate-semialdehyde dehydrogenase/glutarate-semialdehyde dehydrogenase